MTQKKIQRFFNLILFFCAVLISIFIFELILLKINYPIVNSFDLNNYPIECQKRNEDLTKTTIYKDTFLDDGGFRNLTYSKNKKGFASIILDTLCLNDEGYRDHAKIIKIKPFENNTYSFNNKGYRGNEWDLKSSNSNIYLLGGSTAYSLLSNEEDSIHYKLDKYLNKEGINKKYYVLNASLPGRLSFDEYRTITREIDEKNSDIFVFLTGYNNASNNIKNVYVDQSLKYKKKILATSNMILNQLKLRKLSELIMIILDKPSMYKENGVESFKKYSSLSNQYCIKKKIRCIFILQPAIQVIQKPLTFSENKMRNNIFNTDNSYLSKNFNNSYNQFRQHFASKNFEFIDLSNLNNHNSFTGYILENEEYALNNFQKVVIKSNQITKKQFNFTRDNIMVKLNNKYFIKSLDYCNNQK